MVGHVDHGKSTLIGRLLSDTGQVRVERSSRVQSLCEKNGRKFEFAFLLDALEQEQTQGITIDVTEVNWKFEGDQYVFVDTPGHREFLKKMIGGASRVEAAILLLDASEGVTDSFRRQMIVLDLLGVDRRIILINKMDLVDWSHDVWLSRAEEIRKIINPSKAKTWIVPASAWFGENLLSPSTKMPWYSGPTLAQVLQEVSRHPDVNEGPTRFFIQDVYRLEEKRIYVGRVESGSLKIGDELTFHPGHLRSKIRSIEVYGEDRQSATAGEAVGVTLEQPLYLDRGHLGFSSAKAPLISTAACGDLFWLDSSPLVKGDQLRIKMGTATASATVESIEHEIDGETFVKVPGALKVSMFGRVVFQFSEPWAFDRFASCAPTGRFVISRNHKVVGGGRWVNADLVPVEKNEAQVLWFTGLSGAGKTTLARALEHEMKLKNKKVIVLDGDGFRQGLCSDLGFSESDRRENVRRAAHVAKWLCDEGFTVITAFISPQEDMRSLAREIVGSARFKEIFVDCPLEICEERDVKGLYKRARRGEIPEFTGVNSPFERPPHPDVHVRTDKSGVREIVFNLNKIFNETNGGNSWQ